MPEFRLLADARAVAAEAAALVERFVQEGGGTLVISGGTTPVQAYDLLAGRSGLAWGRVTVLFADERCVPPDDPESNYGMAQAKLIARVHPASVHRMAGELGAEEAARRYDDVLSTLGALDLVLLGIGEDGHTASLFPGNPALEAGGLAVAVHGAPKPPPDRVSLSFQALRSARRVIVLATGSGKAEAVRRARTGEVPAGMIPEAIFLLDPAAAGEA